MNEIATTFRQVADDLRYIKSHLDDTPPRLLILALDAASRKLPLRQGLVGRPSTEMRGAVRRASVYYDLPPAFGDQLTTWANTLDSYADGAAKRHAQTMDVRAHNKAIRAGLPCTCTTC